MNKRILFSLCGLILLSSIAFYSCSKNEVAPQNTTNNSAPGNVMRLGELTYSTINTSYSEESRKVGVNQRAVGNISITKIDVSAANLPAIFNHLKQTFGGDLAGVVGVPRMVVIIYNNLSTDNTISMDAITGLSIVTSRQDMFKHDFFNVKGGIASRDTRFTTENSFMFVDDFKTLAEITSPQIELGVLIINGPNNSGGVKNKILINKLGETLLASIPNVPKGGSTEPGCANCEVRKGICQYADGFWDCYVAGGCGSNEINNQQPDALDLTRERAFRDGFMKNSQKGKQYIEYYYKVSYVISVHRSIKASNLAEHISLGKNMIEAAELLQHGADNAIPITAALRDQCCAMIAYYKSLSPNAEYQDILRTVESDFRGYCGKTKAEILSTLN